MKKIFFLLTIIMLSTYSFAQLDSDKWKLFAVTDGGVEVYIDTTSIMQIKIPHKDSYAYKVTSKKYYPDSVGKSEYLSRIRAAYEKLEKKPAKLDKKMKKWENFSYTIIEYMYDCMGKAYKTGQIIEYDNKDKVIVKTKTSDKLPWVATGSDDIGDMMLFYVCDYEQ